MALLVFPSNPFNGQIYPPNPLVGQYQYEWVAADVTWRLLGAATGVIPGTYCPSATSVPRFTVDAVGRITNVQCVELDYVKLNNAGAYNSYVWPNLDGNVGDVLITDGSGNLFWAPGGGGGGGVSLVNAGVGLYTTSGSPITSVGTLNLQIATTTSLGGVIPDGTTVTIDAAGVISATAPPVGFDLAIDGGFVKLSIPTVSPPPTVGTGQYEAMPGSLYWDSTLGELFIYYFDGTNGQWVSTTGSAANLPAGLGISITSGYTKVAIPAQSPGPLPGLGQIQAEPGALYWDTTLGELFYFYDDGFTQQWVSTTGSAANLPAGLGISVTSGYTKIAVPTQSPGPVPGLGQGQAEPGALYWDSILGELFVYYDDGTTAQWVSTTGSGSASLPAPGFGLVLESSTYKTSIPALPLPPPISLTPADATDGSMYYDVGLGAMFYRYNDGVSSQWVQIS